VKAIKRGKSLSNNWHVSSDFIAHFDGLNGLEIRFSRGILCTQYTDFKVFELDHAPDFSGLARLVFVVPHGPKAKHSTGGR